MKYLSDFTWFELNWHRPFALDDVHLLLSRISALTPRGYVAFEVRSLNSQVSYYVGFAAQYSGKMREVFQSTGDVEIVEIEQNKRKPMTVARHLTVSKPILSLNVDVAASVIRSGLAALSATRTGEEAVVQIVLGRGFPPSPVPHKLSDPHESWLDKALYGLRDATADSVKSAKQKTEQFMFHTILRIGASGRNAEGRIDQILSAFRVLQSAGVKCTQMKPSMASITLDFIPEEEK